MKIFMIENEEGFELAQPVEDGGFERLHSLIDGTPRGGSWAPIHMKIISKERRLRSLRRSDAPWMADDTLILRREAADVLAPFLTKYGEALPLACEQADLVVFNPLRLVDALDEPASLIQKFDDGRIMWVDKYVFYEAVVQELQAFKITNLLVSPVFLGEEFVERWRAAGLKGLEFRQVWEG